MYNNYWVTWRTPSGSNNHNLLKPEILECLGIELGEKESLSRFVSKPTQPFAVSGLASSKHPLCISGGINGIVSGNKRFCVEELYYTDLSGHRYGSLKNKRHFNQEYRITDVSGQTEIYDGSYDPYHVLEDHVIQNAESIEVILPPPAGQTGKPLTKIVKVPPKK